MSGWAMSGWETSGRAMPGTRFAALLAAGLALGLGSARADEADQLVVVEAHGVALNPGDTVDGKAPLALKDDQFVTLMSPSGQTIKIAGPSNKAPGAGAGGDTADVTAALKTLVTQKLASSESLGVVRGAGTEPIPPDPWLINATYVGNRCLPDAGPIVLWRPQAGSAVRVTITATDRSWHAAATWAAGSDRVPLPKTVPLVRRATYIVKAGNKEVAITLIAIPPSVRTDAMRAAWMIQEGCDTQAAALLRKLGQDVELPAK